MNDSPLFYKIGDRLINPKAIASAYYNKDAGVLRLTMLSGGYTEIGGSDARLLWSSLSNLDRSAIIR